MTDLLIRFVIGGCVVSLFSVIGAAITHKRIAGIFSGAPSVALASIALAFAKNGPAYVSVEGRSMILGAVGFVAYAITVAWFLERQVHVIVVSAITWILWFLVALGLWSLFSRW